MVRSAGLAVLEAAGSPFEALTSVGSDSVPDTRS
jgi:hypothetical protein